MQLNTNLIKSQNDITFISAAYYHNDHFDNNIIGLSTSNNRYTNYNINFYGKGAPWVSLYHTKIVDLLEILETKCHSVFVCYIDSADTFLNKELDENFIESFRSLDCSILYNAETNCYPLEQFSLIDNSDSEFKYLNSGLFIGYTDKVIEVLKECIKYYETMPQTRKIGWGAPNDQTFHWVAYLRDRLSFGSRIKLDHEHDLFLCIQGKQLTDFDYSQGYVTHNNKRPYFFHCPGNNKITNYKDMMKRVGFTL